jgi:hypothetical protein
MERNFTDENFEGFLRQNTDGFRMRPSAKVWKGISDRLTRRKRRVGYALGISLLLTTALGYYLINDSQSKPVAGVNKPNLITETINSDQAFSNQRTAKENSTTVKPSKTNQTRSANSIADLNLPLAVQNSLANHLQNTLINNRTAMFGLQNNFSPTIVDSYPNTSATHEENSNSLVYPAATDPLSIESVLNLYKARRKLETQFYFTPTVSYRKLNDNNIDRMVTHKPDFGFELGFATKFPVSKTVKFISGLQFNVNRYGIKTYNSITELATIRVTDRNGGIGYVNTITNYNNFTGYQSNWLDNFYFQIAAPTGVEFKVKGDDKVQFGIATTLQPTYNLGDKAYLISSDYKNYAEYPKLIRKWNLSGNLGTYVSYSTGHMKWQVGPQVRYQFLSSYLKTYPVKENLFDFGLRVGISLNNK